MDGASDPKTTPATPTPYRGGEALADIIPPDRRREKMAAIVALSMIGGIALWVVGGRLIEGSRTGANMPAPTAGYVAGRVGPALLRGPHAKVVMPPPARTIVHVWLQGCSDCMPAFTAMSGIKGAADFGVDAPIVNVAYGEADESWARTFGVSDNLVFDPDGSKIVKPMGISSFTTLVVEPDGRVLHRDRPDRPGYVARVRDAVLYGDPNAEPPAPMPTPTADAPPAHGTLDAAAVQRVVATHRADVKRACWEGRAGTRPRSASVTVTLTIGPDGRVAQASSRGDDPSMASCIELRARTWLFPASGSSSTVSIPFEFVQQ